MPIKPHKLGIIGVGRVGDAVLSDAMMSGLFGEICVIDVNEKLAAGQASISITPPHCPTSPMSPCTPVTTATCLTPMSSS